MELVVFATLCCTGIAACLAYIAFLLWRERKKHPKSHREEFEITDDEVLDIPLSKHKR